MGKKYIAVGWDAAEIRDPGASDASKTPPEARRRVFCRPGPRLTIRTAKFFGWPVFSLDGRVWGGPSRHPAKKTRFLFPGPPIFPPAAASCGKARHLHKKTGHLSSWNRILARADFSEARFRPGINARATSKTKSRVNPAQGSPAYFEPASAGFSFPA